MIKAGIFSAPTLRTTPVLTRTLGSLIAAGIQSVRLQLDSGRLGLMANYDRLINGLLADTRQGDHLMVLQDDMVCCPYMLDKALRAIQECQDAVHVLFTPAQNVPDKRDANGWVDLDIGWGGWGGQFLFPREVALDCVNHPFWIEHLRKSRRQADAVTFETLRLLGVRVRTHVPSLFDHIGEESTIGNDHSDGATRGFRFDEWT